MSNSMKQMEKFGGAFWDTLFLFVKDKDVEFINDFIDRLPCVACAVRFREHIVKHNIFYDGNKNEIYKSLWTLRCLCDPKRKTQDTPEALEEYLKFLLIL